MAKKSQINRNLKRQKTVARFASRRQALKAIIRNPESSFDERQEAMAKLQGDGKLIVKQLKRNWDDPKFALFDGANKALARTLCTGDWCWQQDVDEIVHEDDYKKIKPLIRQMPKALKLLCLPVIEYWGSNQKVRIDVNPWKWRLSRNHKHITHGIPKQFRREDEEGNLYAYPGTDGCDYIDARTGNPIQHASFYSPEIHEARVAAMNAGIEINAGKGSQEHEAAVANYNKIFNKIRKDKIIRNKSTTIIYECKNNIRKYLDY